MTESLDLVRANIVLLSDWPTKPVDAVFFFGRSYFDAEKWGLYRQAVDLFKEGIAGNIVVRGSEGERFNETTPNIAAPGKTLCINRFVGMGVPRDRIHYNTIKYPAHTKGEGNSYLGLCNQKGWTTAAALANPHQITRCMLGLVRSINEYELPVDIWAVTPKTTNWHKKVKGSQGMQLKPRIEHIDDEMDRIPRYQAGGDLASFEELFDYLKRRDSKPR